MDAVGERRGTGRLDRRQPVGQHRRQDLHHLAVAVVKAPQLAPYPLQAGRQRPILEGCAVPERTWLVREHRHVMPGIVDSFAAAKAALMLASRPSSAWPDGDRRSFAPPGADNRAVLADDDATGIAWISTGQSTARE